MDEIKVDLSGLKIKDLALFEQAGTGALSRIELVGLLDRVVVGGASELPLTRLSEILEAIKLAVAEIANPKDGQGKA